MAEELNEKSIEGSIYEIRALAGHKITFTKSERQKRIEALAEQIAAAVHVDDEDIVYDAVDHLRGLWRSGEQEGGRGFGLAPLKEEGSIHIIDPAMQRTYASLAFLAEQTNAALRRDGRRIERLKRRIRRLKKRMG